MTEKWQLDKFKEKNFYVLAKSTLSTVLLILILAGIILIRLPGVDDPLLGMNHSRMNTTASIARNFYENGMNILYPQIDWGGNGPGYVQEVFQLHAFLVAVLYKVFGVSDVVGQGLSLIFYATSAVLLFLLARRLFNQQVALFATFFFGVAPLGIFYGRSIHPDTLILLCSLAAVYLFLVWTETDRPLAFLGSAVTLSLAVLMKPVSLYLGLPLIYLCYRRYGWTLFRQWRLYMYAGLSIVPAVLWTWHANQLWLMYGNTDINPWNLPWSPESSFVRSHLIFYSTMAKRQVFLITTVVGLPLLLLGFLLRPLKRIYLAHAWMAGFVIVAWIFAGSYVPHDYYHMGLMPATALLMGFGAGYLWERTLEGTFLPETWTSKVLVLCLCFLVLWSATKAARENYWIPPEHYDQLAFADRLNELTGSESLIILGTSTSRGPDPASIECCRHREPDGRYLGHNPVEFNLSRRKGWAIHIEDWTNELVESLRDKGANYFATWYIEGLEQKPDFTDAMNDRYILVERTENWAVYDLDNDEGSVSSP